MRNKKVLANILLILGLIIALVTSGIAILSRDHAPRLLVAPDEAQRTAENMMAAFCSGDYVEASSYIYGCPSLGTEPENSNLAVELIWTAFRESMEYEISRDCYVLESSVSVDVTVRTLDPSAVISNMEQYAKDFLNRRVAEAADVSELYDADNNFRQEIMDKVLRDAIMQSLTDNMDYREHTLTLNLIQEQGKWWIVPDDQLLTVLSGSF